MDLRLRPRRVPVLVADVAIALAVGVGCALGAVLGHPDPSVAPAVWWNLYSLFV